MKTTTGILDLMIDSMHPKFKAYKPILYVGKKYYKSLCKELNRNVRTYKGFKVMHAGHDKIIAS